MRIASSCSTRFSGPRGQRGMIAMIIAIIVLVSTLLAVIGLMRSVDTSNLIAGTMSFKQGVLQEAERAYSAAKSSIPYGSAIESDSLPIYYASVQTADTARSDIPAGMVTAAAPSIGTTLPADPATGNTVYYVVERLCRSGTTGTTKASCVVPGAYVTGGTNDESASTITPSTAQPAYRLTVRVDGPRNARTYVQTIIR